MRFHAIRRRRRRAGLSLLEVIFSVGIIILGLLGVAVLIPASGRIAQKGNMLDQASRAGHNWFRELETRGYMQPASWVLADAASTAAYQNDVNAGNGQVITWAHEKAFCIDPRFASVNGDSYFPYPATAAFPRMRRISLRASAGANQMTQDQADELFMGHDDLLFDRPVDAKQIPVQVYGQAGLGKRLSEDRLSYLLTVVPKLQGRRQFRDTYIVSTVIMRNRDAAMSIASKAPKPDAERWVEVSTFYGSTGGGGDAQVGDIQLRSRAGRTPIEAQADLKLRRGDWLMLSGIASEFGNPNPQPVFRWYRVVHATDAQPTGNAAGQWFVDVSLHGPDWNSNLSTQATIVTDVVAVFEKTMRLESSSLWMR